MATTTDTADNVRTRAIQCTRLLADLMDLAERVAKNHVEPDPDHGDEDQGEPQPCFNLATFLSELEDKVGAMLEQDGRPTCWSPRQHRFQLNPEALARLAWCSMTTDPCGHHFRGMPILD